MATIETISIVFTGISISLAAFYYISTLRNAQRTQQLQLETRQAQLFSFLIERMDNVEWWTHYGTIRDAQDRTYDEWEEILQDPIIDGGISSILVFLNNVGWLVKKGLLDMEDVVEALCMPVVRVYEHMTPYLEEYERRTGRPQIFPHLKYLYEHLKDRYYQAAQAIKT